MTAPSASASPVPRARTEERRILVVDDDPTVLEIVCRYLRAAGFLVDEAPDGLSALRLAEEKRPHLVVLDRMLPLLDGIEVCRRVRSTWAIPVILLTALNQEDDRIDGLEAGADDYLSKPFSPRELVLRVQAVLRRTGQAAAQAAAEAVGHGEASSGLPAAPLAIGDFTLDTAAHEVRLHGEPLVLTVREFDLLSHLLRHPHAVLGREDLLRSVWGWEFGDLSTVTVHVRRLREKIEADPAHPLLLQTVWGVGYRFDPVPLGSAGTRGAPDAAATADGTAL
ncbi:response regulator transcription factor [Cryobacterium sp. 5B3]|uniref:response regulator transcription factor n=1 Tax=Cryobacterium sp. 5B3 TaxID=3048586 RepID=UPI002AB48412|nr:response regulator transcription factor [Cryobacterium sp. 5B3]MDY7542810.1 response regulator transcription factor [Cryobacterium sp. 5B3]MEB0273960.1 response regulator transcription factor [Cryobacterium sp. 5B3]